VSSVVTLFTHQNDATHRVSYLAQTNRE